MDNENYRRVRALRIAWLSIMVCFCPRSSFAFGVAANQAVDQASVRLVHVQTALLSKVSDTVDLGRIDERCGARIETIVTLRNDTNRTITIESVVSSCGCTAAKVSVQLPCTLTVGQELPIHIDIKTALLSAGQFSKCVVVDLGNDVQPYKIIFTGQWTRALSSTQQILDFGSLQIGSTKTMLLDVSGTRDGHFGKPTKVSIEPIREDIRIERVANPATSTRIAENSDAVESSEYAITLKPMKIIGSVYATIHVSAAAAHPLDVPLYARVTGAVQCSPESVSFGAVGRGTASSQTVVLSGDMSIIQGLRVISQSPFLSGTISKPSNRGGKAQRNVFVTVKLLSAAPPGDLHGQLLLACTGGTEIDVPVSAYVVK